MNKSFNELIEELKENNSQINEIYNDAKIESKHKKRVAFLVCGIIDCIFIYILLNFVNNIDMKNYNFVPIIFPSIFILFFDIIIFAIISSTGKKIRIYNKAYKEHIIPKLIQNFYKDVEYFPNKQMPKEIYKEGKYNEYFDDYKSDDYLEAKIDDKYLIDMAEVLTTKEESYRDSDRNRHTRTVTVFHGLFAKIMIEKSINSNLRITTRLRRTIF